MKSLETPENIRNFQRKLYLEAKLELSFRIYLLYDKIYRPDLPSHAYDLARENAGAAGVDGMTFERIEASGLEEWSRDLHVELVESTHRPSPVKRVMIRKPGGGERPLGRPTIRDRVVQTAAKLVPEPIFEDSAHRYRPRRSAVGAVEEVHKRPVGGYVDVVDADFSEYFDTIPHAQLLRSVAGRVVDRNILRLVPQNHTSGSKAMKKSSNYSVFRKNRIAERPE